MNEHLWIREFCNTCNQCKRKCLGSAIHDDPIVYADGSKRCIDYTKCAVPFTKQHACSVCIKECTLFKGDYMKIKTKVLESGAENKKRHIRIAGMMIY